MSIDSKASPQDSAPSENTPCTDTATQDTSPTVSNASADNSQHQMSTSASLLTSLWPLSSILHISPRVEEVHVSTSSKDTTLPQTTQSEPSRPQEQTEPEPEPYYTPKTTPTFKRLSKLRLSGTREKQLIRAASRAHDDPPPPPDLGMCCGSSCDPCVNDLWREERDTWRERWGVHAVENRKDQKDLEW
jgi:hypothetical protein